MVVGLCLEQQSIANQSYASVEFGTSEHRPFEEQFSQSNEIVVQ